MCVDRSNQLSVGPGRRAAAHDGGRVIFLTCGRIKKVEYSNATSCLYYRAIGGCCACIIDSD